MFNIFQFFPDFLVPVFESARENCKKIENDANPLSFDFKENVHKPANFSKFQDTISNINEDNHTIKDNYTYHCDVFKKAFKKARLMAYIDRITAKLSMDENNPRKAIKSELINIGKDNHKPSTYRSCNICEYKTTHKSHLILHMRTHTGHKPFQCPECDSKFTSKSNMKVHARIHSATKPFECTLCDGKFKAAQSLKRHFNTIHGIRKPYKCDACDAGFFKWNELRIHRRIHDFVIF